ncbi:Smf protein [Candidatus Thiomargarita nelsonii]|uniref:Smf protein n=1 Tax=Candidatus Thiomargarita nelsonii TaxID=1003181 RepID=A0A0A6NYM6_9GAMM|nr:Smf protein [Candidatus Thiomargarita nelsonii]
MSQKHPEEEYWLALARAPGVGPVNFVRLIKHFGDPRSVFEAGLSEWQAFKIKGALLNYLQAPNWQAIEKDMQWLAQPGNHLLTLEHPDYPPLLREIHSAPPILFVRGDCTLLASKQLAIVGTRHPTPEGEKTAREFAEYLSHQGFTITSGMALGIDGASHWGALAGTGKTIAVAGTGLDRVYPPQHRELAHKIIETGALISEFSLGTAVRREHFPLRSRIISGLSLGTLVVEAPERSGARYAARHAAKQGREIFAIPGSIHNPLVKGCHQLIKEGAKLVETAADILEELKIYRPIPPAIENPKSSTNSTEIAPKSPSNSTANTEPAAETSDLDSEYARLLDYLETGASSIDNLVEQSGLTAGEISSMLLILELRGLVAVQPGGLYARIKDKS